MLTTTVSHAPLVPYTILELAYITMADLEEEKPIEKFNYRRQPHQFDKSQVMFACLNFQDIQNNSEKHSNTNLLNKYIKELKTSNPQFTMSSVHSINQLMVDLVGGWEAFKALPIIDLGYTVLSHGAIDFIKPELMNNHPIVKFVDILGRAGIAICAAKNNDYSHLKVQTFYQTMNSSDWISGGSTIIPLDGKHLIENSILEKTAYQNLKELIFNKKVIVESPITEVKEEWQLFPLQVES